MSRMDVIRPDREAWFCERMRRMLFVLWQAGQSLLHGTSYTQPEPCPSVPHRSCWLFLFLQMTAKACIQRVLSEAGLSGEYGSIEPAVLLRSISFMMTSIRQQSVLFGPTQLPHAVIGGCELELSSISRETPTTPELQTESLPVRICCTS